MATCRSCGAPVVWVVTKAGKSMPIDPTLVAHGNIQFSGPPSDKRVHYVVPADDVEAFVSHFSTCPQARNWRRP